MPPPDPLAASRTSRFRVGLGASVVLLLVGVGAAVLVFALNANSGSRVVLSATAEPGAQASPGFGPAPASPASVAIYVHILGAVANPGLYQLREGDRAIDAVAAAGGYTQEADRRQLNLARFLSDGEQIFVPTLEETAAGRSAGAASPGLIPGWLGGRINLNTADSAALESLPQIGPAIAARILAWRTANGRFTSIEDLMGVSGIGEKTFAALRDLVTI